MGKQPQDHPEVTLDVMRAFREGDLLAFFAEVHGTARADDHKPKRAQEKRSPNLAK